MANAKDIKSHIKSVKDTQKITNAMYLISSTKLRRAKAELDRTRPYFKALGGEIKRIFRTVEKVESRYFYPADGSHLEGGPVACLVITADKGLAGSYNQSALKESEKLLHDNPGAKLYVVGEYGRQYFHRHGIQVEHSFLYTAQNPTMQRAREISSLLLGEFDKGNIKKIFVIYTDMVNGMTTEAKTVRLLPFHRAQFVSGVNEKEVAAPFEFTPSVEEVLENLMPSYVSGFIYSALVDSFCSEQEMRMTAMDSANKNAEKILSELSVKYNRVRQASITQEITEVSAGAKAQREKGMVK